MAVSSKSQGGLTASLAEHVGDLTLPDDGDEGRIHADLDPLPSLELPEDRRVITLRELAASAASAARSGAGGRQVLHATGAAPGATALLLRSLVVGQKKRVVALTADVDTARALSADASFLLGAHDADDAE